MILLKQNISNNRVLVTASEIAEVTPAFYLFVFEHILTKDKFSFVLADTSAYPYRYNEFNIPTTGAIANASSGFYRYWIYGQASDSNTDPALAAQLLEVGKMKLLPADSTQRVAFKQYQNPPTEFVNHGY